MTRWLLVYFGFPVIVFISKLIPKLGSKYEQWFVKLNNRLFLEYTKKNRMGPLKNVLLVLPHCMQFDECDNRIIKNIQNCKKCGKCKISDMVKFQKEFGIIIKVATGGRLAKRIIDETNPDYVIAIACEKELSEGICAVYPLQVFGITNIRPFGPCINTTVDASIVESTLKNLSGNASL